MASKPVVKGIKGKHLLVVNTGNRKKRFTLKRLRDLGCNLIILNATENWGSAPTTTRPPCGPSKTFSRNIPNWGRTASLPSGKTTSCSRPASGIASD